MSIIALVSTRLKRGSLINWLQDLYPEVAVQLEVPGLKGRRGRLLIALRNSSLRRARANVVIGSRMADQLLSAGVRADQIHKIPNWTDENAVKPISTGSSVARRNWSIAEGKFVVGYSGNLGRAHETDTLVAAAHLLRHRSDIMFLFVGGGVESEKLRAEAARRGLQNFLFKPHQPRDALSDSLGAADVHWLSLRPQLEGLIVPSKFYGIVSAGRPVIAVSAKQGEIAAAIAQHGCGIVVEPGDGDAFAEAITRLADNPQLRIEMGRRARRASEETYSRNQAFAQWEAVLTNVCSAAGDRVQEPA